MSYLPAVCTSIWSHLRHDQQPLLLVRTDVLVGEFIVLGDSCRVLLTSPRRVFIYLSGVKSRPPRFGLVVDLSDVPSCACLSLQNYYGDF